MSAIWTITRRDFRSYFTSPIAYIVIAAFMTIMGIMFFSNLYYFQVNQLQYQQYNMGKGASITDGIIRPLYGNMNVILLFLLPLITMKVFAEEKKMHTIELLLTSPITVWQLILGKYLSSLLFLAVALAFSIVYPVVLLWTGNPDLGPIVTSYLGTFLMGGTFLAFGVLYSSMTENQVVAAALGFLTALFFFIVNWMSQFATGILGDVINYLSLISHFNNFGQGTIQTSDLIYYVSMIFLGLFFTSRVLDSYRWR